MNLADIWWDASMDLYLVFIIARGLLTAAPEASLGVIATFGQRKVRELGQMPIGVDHILRITPVTSSLGYQAPKLAGYLSGMASMVSQFPFWTTQRLCCRNSPTFSWIRDDDLGNWASPRRRRKTIPGTRKYILGSWYYTMKQAAKNPDFVTLRLSRSLVWSSMGVPWSVPKGIHKIRSCVFKLHEANSGTRRTFHNPQHNLIRIQGSKRTAQVIEINNFEPWIDCIILGGSQLNIGVSHFDATVKISLAEAEIFSSNLDWEYLVALSSSLGRWRTPGPLLPWLQLNNLQDPLISAKLFDEQSFHIWTSEILMAKFAEAGAEPPTAAVGVYIIAVAGAEARTIRVKDAVAHHEKHARV
ncbi:uncharacterized protein CLUP02_12797 [Colletotrichum lupini]|uniref:Uncharacterized protein n=1 Tax=Colletotrichum lupini TaxID=145971 RepID=A0A9Q8WKT8_9PEZI|nr:uncharacterized protein CLUP02_12797 [Colletotrichum lupini]UQC87293.1 hypothetical protein CLUP02_12797 [Colletotrichum lupini]